MTAETGKSLARRDLLKAGLAAGAAMAAPAAGAPTAPAAPSGGKFKLKYAPHFGMFQNHAGPDSVNQVKFMADQGFSALEDNGMKGRSKEEQERIARELARLNMTMGVFVASAGFGNSGYASGDAGTRDRFLKEMQDSVEVAKRVNAKWCTVVPGDLHHRLEMDYQTANVVDLLRRAAAICEPAGLVMVLEPLNPFRDHPNMFLSKVPQAFMICRAVNSPSCKILFDMYHQQITEGNIIPNIDLAWSEVAYFQTGDNPGRNEPTTGEMNYKNIFRHIHGKGFQGVLGMEHGNARPGKEGELAVINAYRACDAF
uniref:Hydroxypyruvate isomerase n=1 Tax=uncultured Armatimonadetes bacterium TaxID=157466 RepID=A0A6J4IE99_9BACT|nr:Hydroxypyruvate isomerase [uncultured Armatimonadetes bacterium]